MIILSFPLIVCAVLLPCGWRWWRLLGGCLLVVLLWAGSITTAAAAELSPSTTVIHVLNRLSLGLQPGDLQRVNAMGIERYVQEQLAPESIAEPQTLTDRLAQLETLSMSPMELYQRYHPQRKEALRHILEQAREARLLRAIESPRQLQEVMVDFWYNHFNIAADKGLDRFWVGAYEQQAIRPHALGNFRELLGATARHPALLFYLDNWLNTDPNSPGAIGKFNGLNENYARELMELHTLGVNGGYTQQDVITLAKILTGWGICRLKQPAHPDGFCFYPQRHDASDKVLLGQPIPGGGAEEVDRALDILATHPATARHISYQLAQYFVTDQPTDTLVDALAQRFLATQGDVRSVLDALIHRPEFWQEQTVGAKFKTPYQYVISAIRASGRLTVEPRLIALQLRQQGMPLYGCDSPEGYKNTELAWLSPYGMTRRLSWATTLSRGKFAAFPQTENVPIDAQQLAHTLGNSFSTATQQAIAASPPALHAALMLASPEFMHR